MNVSCVGNLRANPLLLNENFNFRADELATTHPLPTLVLISLVPSTSRALPAYESHILCYLPVKAAEQCLKKVLGRTSLNFEELRTILVEVETTINNRPLTYMYNDSEGVSYPLTPSDLIYGRKIAVTPNQRQFQVVSTNQSLTKKAKHQKLLLNHFTKRWRNEYLLSLRKLRLQTTLFHEKQ